MCDTPFLSPDDWMTWMHEYQRKYDKLLAECCVPHAYHAPPFNQETVSPPSTAHCTADGASSMVCAPFTSADASNTPCHRL